MSLKDDPETKILEQIKTIDEQIIALNQKYQIQNKRIKFLKKDNEDLKEKISASGPMSEEIQNQNVSIKKRNRQLKNQLKNLKQQISNTKTQNGPSTITIKDMVVNSKTEEVDLPKSQVTDEDLENLKFFPKIKTLILGENKITDQGVKKICQGCLGLRKLFLNHTELTDNGLIFIHKLQDLKYLDLRSNKLTDKVLPYICKLTKLTQLSLSNNQITDQGANQLLNLEQLRYLDITSNLLTEKGGMVLAKLRNLSNLYLSHNKITKQCVFAYMQFAEIKVLDVRFNSINNNQKDQIKANKPQNLQLFV